METISAIIGYMILIIPIIAWGVTIRDIYYSDFENENKWKEVWLWSVVVTGYLAIIFYYMIGVKRKTKAFRFLRSANIYKYC
jgi:hypothetical protein